MGSPSFSIPRFRFVELALAIEQLPDSHQLGKESGWVFLIEEVIQKETQGISRKYLNNVSPVPLQMSNKDDKKHRAFLTFSQHVQYFKTKKLIFVSDYQGKQGNPCTTMPTLTDMIQAATRS